MWIDLFKKKHNSCCLELFYEFDFEYSDQRDSVDKFVKMTIDKERLKDLGPSAKEELYNRYFDMMRLFNENVKYCGYSILLFQKRHDKEEAE